MARFPSEEVEKAAVKATIALMAASARTAPKTGSTDFIKTLVLDGDDLEVLAAAMDKKVEEKAGDFAFFARDANNVRKSAAVLLIGVDGPPKNLERPLNCGACGYRTCEDFSKVNRREREDFRGPLCIFQAVDLGIALCSAVKIASELNIDNRMMYTIGAAARKLELLDSDIIIGIPLSVAGKSPFFDRG